MAADTDNVHVTLGLGEGDLWPACDNGQRWNGYVCPTFSRASAAAIVAWNQAADLGDDDDRLSWDGDVVVITSPVFALEDPDYRPERIEQDRHGRYPIGAYAWTWSIAEPLTRSELSHR